MGEKGRGMSYTFTPVLNSLSFSFPWAMGQWSEICGILGFFWYSEWFLVR